MSIDLSFHGAAGGVTGSSYLLSTSRARVLARLIHEGARRVVADVA